MLISQSFVIDQPVDAVWAFFDDIPQVAACIPGANLTNKVAEDSFQGDVVVSAGPVKLEFAGTAIVKSRDNDKKILVLDANGADKKGRGAAQALLTAGLKQTGGGTNVDLSLDLQISGAAAQYGRGLVADVTAVLVKQAASNMQARMTAISKGLDPNSVVGAKAASGLSIGLNAAKRAIGRVLARFFLPYTPEPRR
ncbi:MAG: SRPBCC family protein [Actinomycetes bacterium]